MIYVYIVVLAAYFLLLVVSRGEEEKGIFRKMASCILRGQQKHRRSMKGGRHDWKRDSYRRQLGEKLKILQPSVAVSKQVREHYLTQYSTLLKVVFWGVVLCLAAWIGAHSRPLLIDGSYIGRNPSGAGEIPIELSAQMEGKEEEIFEYVVKERVYTEEEIEALYEQAAERIAGEILGDNKSLEDVRENLNLVTELESYPFEISWESSSYGLVNTDGTVNNEELTEGQIVTLTAHLCYEQQTWEHQLYVNVNPVIYSEEELLRRQIMELLHTQAEKTRHEKMMKLPESIEDQPIVWREMVEDGSGYLLVLVLLAAGVLYWGHDKELDQRLERRKRELLLDYPEVVNKLALYMGAGMTVRSAFFKLGEDYKKQNSQKKRYVYEEIVMICYELQSGRSEAEAYDHFGKRCQVQCYMKLSALLTQNIRKGSYDLLSLLRQEADNAFMERKSLAKKLGEEAGTKLLLPMMMMLCIVMVIIMIPAYFSFM